MSILDRLQMLLRSEMSHLSRRGDGRGAVRETLAEARQALQRNRAAEQRLNRDYQDALDDVHRYEELAVRALRSGDEAAARDALRTKQDAERRASGIRQRLDGQREELDDLRRALDALEMRIEARRDRGGWQPPAAPPPRNPYVDAPSPTWRPPAPAPPPPRPPSPDALGGPALQTSMDHFAEIEGRIAGLEAEVGSGFAIDRYGRTPDDPLYDDVDERFRRFELERDRRRLGEEAARRGEGAGEGDPGDADGALGRLRRRMEDDS